MPRVKVSDIPKSVIMKHFKENDVEVSGLTNTFSIKNIKGGYYVQAWAKVNICGIQVLNEYQGYIYLGLTAFNDAVTNIVETHLNDKGIDLDDFYYFRIEWDNNTNDGWIINAIYEQ